MRGDRFKKILFNENLDKILEHLREGAFLTVKYEDKINTMTIGWASLGIFWNKPILIVAVRKSRYTYDLIEKSDDFTLSIPLKDNYKKALRFAGAYSGRDVDKFEKLNLPVKKSNLVDTPVIGNCDFYFECKKIFSQEMNPLTLQKEIVDRFYQVDNYHTFYFGEIVDCYRKK